jgi:(S)-ureidoglycine aminohydrolase
MTETRGAHGHGYTLITPANHYASRLPELGDQAVIKLVTPRLAPSRIGEYLLQLAPDGGTFAPFEEEERETFLYVLDGLVTVDAGGAATLDAGGFAYLPPETTYGLRAGDTGARVLAIKREYEPTPRLQPPGLFTAHRDDEPFAETAVPGFTRRELLPVDDPAYDFAMSLLRFEPGVGLAFVEIHDEEHGLYMTAGAGTYLLDRERHEVTEGDFIYMAPYCPQSFTASGDGPAEYLLYKDAWRDGFDF